MPKVCWELTLNNSACYFLALERIWRPLVELPVSIFPSPLLKVTWIAYKLRMGLTLKCWAQLRLKSFGLLPPLQKAWLNSGWKNCRWKIGRSVAPKNGFLAANSLMIAVVLAWVWSFYCQGTLALLESLTVLTERGSKREWERVKWRKREQERVRGSEREKEGVRGSERGREGARGGEGLRESKREKEGARKRQRGWEWRGSCQINLD